MLVIGAASCKVLVSIVIYVNLGTVLEVEDTNIGPLDYVIYEDQGVALVICIKDPKMALGKLYARPGIGHG